MVTDLASFYSRTQRARKVIVVDLGFLGDTIHLIPALWELKRCYPQAALHVLTSPVGCEVLKLVSCVDRTWAMERDPKGRTLRAQWRLVRALRREGFDVAINFSGSDRTIIMTALTGAPHRVAHRGGRKHFWNRWFIREWAPRQDPNLIVYEQRRGVLAACGFKLDPPKFGLHIDEEAAKWAAGKVPDWAIHISPCSSKPTREWPLEHHASLLRMLWEREPAMKFIISTGTKARELDRMRQLREAVKDPRIQILDEPVTIPQLAALLSRCQLHVGPDSGVLHLAVALGVKTVSFFREQGAWKSFMPTGPLHRVISMPCHCIDGHNAPCEKTERSECFEQISPARVASMVMEQISSH